MKISFKKLSQSFKNAFQGLKAVTKEHSFYLMLLITLLILLLAFFLKISFSEWLVLTLLIGLVLSLEIFNTALEKLLDFLQPNHSEKVKIIKDLVAAAVLIISLVSVVIGLFIFLPKIF